MTTQLSSINLFEFPSITLLQNENQSDLNDLPLGGITEGLYFSLFYHMSIYIKDNIIIEPSISKSRLF